MSSDHLMTKEELQYFTENFAENQKNGALNLDFFFNICRSYNKILNKTVLEESLKDIKTSLEKKNSTQQITIKQDEYFNYINTILKDQFQSQNQDDPEMEKLFKSLAGKEGDYVYKKKLSEIIKTFGLLIDLDQFFRPVGGAEEINFNEFCTLFRTEKKEENFRKTFMNFIDKSSKEPEEKEEIKAIYKANFPIKYYGD